MRKTEEKRNQHLDSTRVACRGYWTSCTGYTRQPVSRSNSTIKTFPPISLRVGVALTSKFCEAARGLVRSSEQPLPVSTQISPQAPPTWECLSKPDHKLECGRLSAVATLAYISTAHRLTCRWVLFRHQGGHRLFTLPISIVAFHVRARGKTDRWAG